MASDRERLRGAERRLRELEAQIQQFIDTHSDKEIAASAELKRLCRLADNAEQVVNQLKKKTGR